MAEVTVDDHSVRVLVIEDDPNDRDLLLRQLRKSGMDSHVKFISDGREALNFLTTSIHRELIAIFLDLRLPGLSGLELLQQLRQRDELHHLPVIVMTSSNDPKDLQECQRLRVINYVSKPVSFSAFYKAVADVFHLPKTNTAHDAP